MKIESDTLYQQWRNLIIYCPERCYPGWVDLEVSPMMRGETLEKIREFQSKPKGYARYGYEWFIEDMYSLLHQQSHEIIPKAGAHMLSLRYQKPRTVGDTEMFFDYVMVPKMSRFSAVYACPDYDFPVIRRTGRFLPKSYARSVAEFNLGEAAKQISEEGEDFYRLQRTYEKDLPLPDAPISRPRRNQAEIEWLDLNLLAGFQFNKNTVQLLYMPTDRRLAVPALYTDLGPNLKPEAKSYSKVKPKKRIGKRIKERREGDSDTSYSHPLMVTAADILAGKLNLASLEDTPVREMPGEEFTDIVSQRRLVDDERLDEIKGEELEEDQIEQDHNPYATFIFSLYFPEVERHSDPMHKSREDDPNRSNLYRKDRYLNFLRDWLAKVYDPVSDEFVAKSLEEWQADCIIDGIKLLPLEYIPRLFLRGLSCDQILVLSSLIEEGTPDTQIDALVENFLKDETQVRLR